MEIKSTFQLSLPIRTFSSQLYVSPFDHDFDAGTQKRSFTFLYIVKGNVKFHTLQGDIHGKAGDFFYIPNGIRYNSVWRGEGGTEHYCIHAIPMPSDQLPTESYSLQKVPSLSTPRMLDEIVSLYVTMKDSGDSVCEQCALFFSICAKVFPLLKKETKPAFSRALTDAMQYIQDNYAKPLNVPIIASALHVSESTLYHTFRRELGTTPIKYYNGVRIERVISELDSIDSIESVAYRNGFESYGYFRMLFKEYTGMTPRQYRIRKK